MTAVMLQTDARNGDAELITVVHVTTSAENTANAASITIDGVASVDHVLSVSIENSSGVQRLPQAATAISGKVVTVTDSGLAADEIIRLICVGSLAL